MPETSGPTSYTHTDTRASPEKILYRGAASSSPPQRLFRLTLKIHLSFRTCLIVHMHDEFLRVSCGSRSSEIFLFLPEISGNEQSSSAICCTLRASRCSTLRQPGIFSGHRARLLSARRPPMSLVSFRCRGWMGGGGGEDSLGRADGDEAADRSDSVFSVA